MPSVILFHLYGIWLINENIWFPFSTCFVYHVYVYIFFMLICPLWEGSLSCLVVFVFRFIRSRFLRVRSSRRSRVSTYGIRPTTHHQLVRVKVCFLEPFVWDVMHGCNWYGGFSFIYLYWFIFIDLFTHTCLVSLGQGSRRNISLLLWNFSHNNSSPHDLWLGKCWSQI